MNLHDTEISGFLDIKSTGRGHIAQKAKKKTFALSKIWKRLWCSAKRSISGLGMQVQFDAKLRCCSSNDALKPSERSSSVIIPPDAIVYRIHSRTRQFAFGISLAKDKKPMLSLSANSETETQRWMANIRHLLKPRRYCCAEESHDISIVDNAHSKAAGLTGLYGDLIANETGIFIKNVYTGEIIKTFEWKEFSQFHLITSGRPEDVKRICVMHTTKEFCCGIGELHIFCLKANRLLQDLVTQGRGPKHKQKSLNFNVETFQALIQDDEIDSPPVQLAENDLLSTSSTEDIYEPYEILYEQVKSTLKEINISIVPAIYEEVRVKKYSQTIKFNSNVDEDKILYNLQMEPPPLPPRQRKENRMNTFFSDEYRMRKHSYSKISKINVQDTNIYMRETTLMDNSNYVPMSPQMRDNIFESDVMEDSKENDYVIMH